MRRWAYVVLGIFVAGIAIAQGARYFDYEVGVTVGSGAGKTLDQAILDGDLGGGGGTTNYCYGDTDACVVIEDDGGGAGCASGVAGDKIIGPEMQCAWNDELMPILRDPNAAGKSSRADVTIVLAWPHLGAFSERYAMGRSVFWCITNATGDTLPTDCDTTDQSALNYRTIRITGLPGSSASIMDEIADPQPEPRLEDGVNVLGSDVGLWLGASPSVLGSIGVFPPGWDNGANWYFDNVIVTPRGGWNATACGANTGVYPLIVEAGSVDGRSSITVNVTNLGTCQANAHLIAPPIVFVGTAGGVRGGLSGEESQIGEHAREPMVLNGPDRGFYFAGDYNRPPDIGLGFGSSYGSSGAYLTPRDTWRGGQYEPILRLRGPGTHIASDFDFNDFYMNRTEIGEGVMIRPFGVEPLFTLNQGSEAPALTDVGRILFEGEYDDLQALGYANINPLVRFHTPASTLRDSNYNDPAIRWNGIVTRWDARQHDKGMGRCAGTGVEEEQYSYVFMEFGSEFEYRVCNNGLGDTGRCPQSSALSAFYPHYVQESLGGMTGRAYCALRADDGFWYPKEGAFFDHSTTGPDAERKIRTTRTNSTIDLIVSSWDVGTWPGLQDTGAGFTTTEICEGDCLAEPFAYVTTKSGGDVDFPLMVADVTTSDQISMYANLYTGAGTGLDIDYQIQRARCYEPHSKQWISCDDPRTELNPFDEFTEYWWLHDHKMQVWSEPDAATSCVLFWTRNGVVVGNDWNLAPSATSEKTKPPILGSAELDDVGESIIEGITNGFQQTPRVYPERDEVLKLRMIDAASGGRCFEPEFSAFTQCTTATHVGNGGSCGAGTPVGGIVVVTDAFDENDCNFTGGGATEVATQLMASGETNPANWDCAPASTGTPLIGGAVLQAYVFPENVVPIYEDEICDNGQDDDGDFLADGLDPDCPPQ